MDLQKIREWLLNNILSILTMIGPSLCSILAGWIGYASNLLNPLSAVLIIIMFLFSVIVIVKNVWNIASYKSYHYPWLKIRENYNYEVVEKRITYKCTDNDTLLYSRYMNIKSCSNCLRTLYDKYIWTGVQEDTIRISPRRGIANIEPKSHIGIWRYFILELDNEIKKGKTKEILYEWPELEKCSNSSPFFSTSTDEPTKKIILSLSLGRKYADQEIICEEFRAIDSDSPIIARKEKLDDEGNYIWTIEGHEIKRFRYYRIRWSWTTGQQAAEIEK